MADIKINTNIILAPMSGVTDLSFRMICRRFGAKLCFYEMIDANALRHEHPATKDILKTNDKDKPIAAQLLGADPDAMLEAARKLLAYTDIAFLDINCACPVKKVIKKGAGASLLQDKERLFRIIEKLSSTLPLPITIKMRIGYTKKDIPESVSIAKGCQERGASMLFVHGRTRSEGYSGTVDYGAIRRIKNAVKIPVFGSGNVFDAFMAKKMFDETGCDGILVARGALGAPWIFNEIESYLKTGKVVPDQALSFRKKILREHLSCINKYKAVKESGKLGFMRKIAMWYLKGLPKAAVLRNKICRAASYGELKKLIDKAR